MLGNLAGEGSATRDLVLNAGALAPLVNNLKKTSWDRLSLLRILTWTLSNLCDGQPRPVFDISIVLPYLAKVCSSDWHHFALSYFSQLDIIRCSQVQTQRY